MLWVGVSSVDYSITRGYESAAFREVGTRQTLPDMLMNKDVQVKRRKALHALLHAKK